MRWNKPSYQDERTIKRFLLFPRCINREFRWLEIAAIRQYWNGAQGWCDLRWED